MHRSLSVICAVIALAACYHSTMAPNAETVRLTLTADQVKGCESRGVFQVKDRQGGLFGQGIAKKNVEINAKNEAFKLGGNVVLLSGLKNGYWGSNAAGEAFRCPTP